MTSSSRKIVFFILLIGLSYVAYAYMIKPANQSLNEQKATVEQKRAKLRELDEAMAARNDLQAQLVELEDAIRFFESKLPPTSEVDTVLKDVTVIARKHGLASKKISTKKRNTNNGYVEQPLEMELDGGFNSYYSFLLELEKLDRITKIRQLSLKKKSRDEGQTNAKFVMSIFFLDADV
jgi:type IV pilus assembly protein PilO